MGEVRFGVRVRVSVRVSVRVAVTVSARVRNTHPTRAGYWFGWLCCVFE